MTMTNKTPPIVRTTTLRASEKSGYLSALLCMFVAKICLLHKMTLFYLTFMIDKSPKICLFTQNDTFSFIFTMYNESHKILSSSKTRKISSLCTLFESPEYNGAK